jgi:hypothetical protein
LGKVLVFALLAAWNPLLLAVVPVMLISARPKRLMAGYLLGAYTVSIGFGVVFLFGERRLLAPAGTVDAISAPVELALGALLTLVALTLALGLDKRVRRAPKRKKAGDQQPLWQRLLDRGSLPLAYVVGAVFTLPGARYIVALNGIDELGFGPAGTVLGVLAVNLVMLVLIELPLLSYIVGEEWTPTAVDRARAWVTRNGRWILVAASGVAGALLLLRSVTALAQ